MRLLTFSKLLVLGATAVYAYKHRRQLGFRSVGVRGQTHAEPDWSGNVVAADLIPDPGDPVQGFDEVADLHVSELQLDALDSVDAEAAQDLAAYENDLDEDSIELDTPSQTTLDAHDLALAANDRTFDDHDSFEEGQNWVEALETSAVEYGAAPEAEVDPDEADKPHPSDMRDTPVADRGSGGPAGA